MAADATTQIEVALIGDLDATLVDAARAGGISISIDPGNRKMRLARHAETGSLVTA